MDRKNLAARAAHWSATHRKTAIFGWLARSLPRGVGGVPVGPEEIIEVDEARVVVVNRVRGRGRGSGVEVDATGAQLWTITGGEIRSVKLYQSKADALEAVGLAHP
jgi:ketosteroid isomerase-like protein